MTFSEVERAVESYARVKKKSDREKASFDYILADLIGRSISRVYNSSNKLPPIDEIYPTIFTKDEVKVAVEEKKANLSALRFKLFAQAYNNKFKEDAKADE
jgi:hypothetical protein